MGGDKKGWPLFISIGNIHSGIRNTDAARAFVQLATLPTVPKKPSTRIGNTAKKDWGANKDDVLQQTFGIILADLPRLYREGIVINCSDGKQRIGHPVQGGWIADYKEYGTLFQVNNDSCVMCEIPKDNMGDNVKGPVRDSELYKVKYDEYLKIKRALETKGLTMKQQKPLRDDRDKIVDWFKVRRVHLADRILHDLPGMTQTAIWKPDILHTLYEGVAKYLLAWLEDFLKKCSRLKAFNHIWLTIPRYNEDSSPNKSIFELTQKTGKEMRNAIRNLLPVLAIALTSPVTAIQKAEWEKIQLCTRYLVDFMLLCHYKVHTDETLSLMDHYLAEFHRLKDVFKPYRAGAAVKEAMEAARNGNARLDAATRRDIEERLTHFNIPKFHLLVHFTEAIRQFGSPQNWSTEIVEMLLKPQKAAYAGSNKNEHVAQVIAAVAREHVLAVRALNLEELARRIIAEPDGFGRVGQIWLREIQKALMLFGDPKDRNLAARMNRETPGAMDAPLPVDENGREIIPPLFPNAADLVRHRLSGIIMPKKKTWKRPHRLGLLAEFYEIPELVSLVHKYMGFPSTVDVDEHTAHLHVDMRSCLHILADGFQTETLQELKARCGLPRHLGQPSNTYNEAVYYEHGDGNTQNGNFRNYRIGLLEALFVIWVPDEAQMARVPDLDLVDYASPTSYRLALVRQFKYDNNGLMQPPHELARVRYNDNAELKKPRYSIVPIHKILRPAHLIPDAYSTTMGSGTPVWYVNNRIDDATWALFYGNAR